MNSRRATVFRVEEDGLDAAAFLAGVRQVVLAHGQTDSMVTGALVRHIDFLLSTTGVADGDPQLAERSAQVEAALKSILSHSSIPVGPNTAQFKAIIADPPAAPEQKKER